MSKKKEYIPTPEEKAWREGYDHGVQQTLRNNDDAIKIGNVILDVIGRRFEFKHEDY